ncbi:hypothetical protein B0H34DRAFT_788231 [Crassisporium funariophilum]|nr:hypothetical protein B0H34DRAFT_788231 [Crassisporium funariophilum]
MNPQAPLPIISGTIPGLVDRTQPSRVLRTPESTLSFAYFDPGTATSHDIPDLDKLSLKDQLCRPKRIVVETIPNRGSSWRFVPNALLDHDANDEGQFPRIVNICGKYYECSQEQWDIYKLDPKYDCLVIPHPSISAITLKTSRDARSQSSGQQSSRASSSGIEDGDRMVVDDDNTSAPGGSAPFRRPKRRFTIPKRYNFTTEPPESPERPKRKANECFQSLRSPEEEENAYLKADYLTRNTSTYDPKIQKRTRTLSPASRQRELQAKRAVRQRRKSEKWEQETEARKHQRERHLLSEVLSEVPQTHSYTNVDDETKVDDETEDDDAARLASSRKKLAELEADRPLWEAAKQLRELRELEEEEERKTKAEARRARWRDEQRLQEEASLRQEREREEEIIRKAERREKLEKERQIRYHRWNSGDWTPCRAVERYRLTTFSEEFPLTFHDVPWPTLQNPADNSPQNMDWDVVTAFFVVAKDYIRGQEYRDFLKSSFQRFHPDRWSGRKLYKNCTEVGEFGFASTNLPSGSDLRRSSRLQRAPFSSPLNPSSSSSWPTPSPNVQNEPAIPMRINLPTTHGTAAHPEPPVRPAQPQHNTSLYVRVMTYFGLGRRASHARKSLVSVIWNLCWGFVQIVVIVTMLILTGTIFRSPMDHNLSEWTACERPLGVWATLWAIRVVLASCLAYWEFVRDRILHPRRAETEAGTVNPVEQPPGGTQNSQSHDIPGQLPTWANATAATPATDPTPAATNLRHGILYQRLTLLSSLMTLSWFLTAHILEYTSVNTCRHSSPHLWWLVFGILCIMYFMVLEVVLLGFIVLIVAPILFIFWNIFLICIGRHPLQNPNMIKPEIGKLPKAVVERIPLVMYIPPPPEEEEISHIVVPHEYPPKNTPTVKPSRRRFKLLRNFTSFRTKKNIAAEGNQGEKKEETIAENEGPISWEEHWEQGDYPLITLEGNRAACAICLMDFEEPKRKNPPSNQEPSEKEAQDMLTTTSDVGIQSISSGSGQGLHPHITEDERQEQLKLVDAGDGAQPLRLLACSHVFHKTCLDPWLTDVSGRCPVCQRAVEIPKPSKKSRRPV